MTGCFAAVDAGLWNILQGLAVRFKGLAGDRPILATMLVTCVVTCVVTGVVTNVTGLIGLTGGNVASSAISVGIAILISTAAAVSLAQAVDADSWAERIGWALVWFACALISILISFAFWFHLASGAHLTDRTAREAARESTVSLTRFAGDYSLLAEKSAALSDLSKAKSLEEIAKGDTCEAGAGATGGPRQRLRDRDAASFGQYAAEFAEKRTDIEKAVGSLDQLYRDGAHDFYNTSSMVVDHAYAATVAAADDPELAAFRTFLRERIAEGQHPITDRLSGTIFNCADAELAADMRAALAVVLPSAPANPPTIAEPTLAAAASRPFLLIAHPVQFSLDLDVRPLLLGSLIDFLQAVLVLALRRGRARRGSEPDAAQSGQNPTTTWRSDRLRRALEERSGLGLGLQRLSRQFSEPGSWLRTLDGHAITLPRGRRGTDDYLLAPQSEDEESLKVRALAAFLKANDNAVLHQVALKSGLPLRWQEKLGCRVQQDVRVEVYMLSAGLLNELMRDATGCPTPSAPNDGGEREARAAGAESAAAFHDEQLGFGF